MSQNKYFDSFSDISDYEFYKAAQLLKSSLHSDSLFREEDLSTDEFIALTPILQNPYCDQWNTVKTTLNNDDGSYGRNDAQPESRFREPMSSEDVDRVQQSRFPNFPKKTVSNATWAVTLCGEWRAHRNALCLSDDETFAVYLDKPFTQTDEWELQYALPLFLREVRIKMDLNILQKHCGSLWRDCRSTWKLKVVAKNF
jgi:hypothetical protein